MSITLATHHITHAILVLFAVVEVDECGESPDAETLAEACIGIGRAVDLRGDGDIITCVLRTGYIGILIFSCKRVMHRHINYEYCGR